MAKQYPTTSFLSVKGTEIVDESGQRVILRGCGLGGWMNMENFITGFPGHEHRHREAMLAALGKEKYDFFFDRFLTYFFGEEDALMFQELGLNCIRIPFNYRHFEDDDNPMVLKEEGFKQLDRVVNICSKLGIYTILDLHAAPGGQNGGWHSDNDSAIANFWNHKHFQDRAIWLWKEIAKHYKENPWVAGYNPLNEPADPKRVRLPAFYDRMEREIRAIDPKHMFFLDGNTFAKDFIGFDRVLPNSVYACHDYCIYGFPRGGRYKGTPEQLNQIHAQYKSRTEFMTQHNVPAWTGEFGPVYANAEYDGPEFEDINAERVEMLGKQLDLYDKVHMSWSIWLWKDVGYQGMVYTSPKTEWMKTLASFMLKKRTLVTDQFGNRPSPEVEALFVPIHEWIDRNVPTAKKTYPYHWGTERHVMRLVRECFMSDAMQDEFAAYFKDMTMDELDQMAKSFALPNCTKREGLNRLLTEHNVKSVHA